MIASIDLKHLTKFSALLMILFLSSCASKKDILYFQDEPLTTTYIDSEPRQLVYKPDDILTITVSAAENPELVQPFNLGIVTDSGVDNISANGSMRLQTYLIDHDGNIDFPVLGTIKIAGMTRTEATAMLREKITPYAKNPIVNIRLVNFTVTILGEVSNPGTFTIQDERITLTEALGMAGDLTIFGNRKDILLIREVDGKKKFAKIDLTSISSVNSPLYHLEQNDVIIVDPNNAKIRSSNFNQNNAVVISAVGTLATIVAIVLANK